MDRGDVLEFDGWYEVALMFCRENRPDIFNSDKFAEYTSKYMKQLQENPHLKLEIADIEELNVMKGVEDLENLNVSFRSYNVLVNKFNAPKLNCKSINLYISLCPTGELWDEALQNLSKLVTESCTNQPQITLYITECLGDTYFCEKIKRSNLKVHKIYYRFSWKDTEYLEFIYPK